MRGVRGSLVGSLPAEVTVFVGRHRQVAEVKRLLSASRLVTLTGVGGVGKSRLALRVAHEMRREFPDGVWLVELAKVHEPSLLSHAVVDALELQDQSARDPAAVLAEHVAGKRLLLILDNCEHVLDGCRQLATVLLLRAPGVAILATSRESLMIAGERPFRVPPLSLPPTAESADGQGEPADGLYEALTLFEQRAAAVAPEFRLGPHNQAAVAGVCQRLDGLPLAIELAAVRIRALSVSQILARLEDRYRLLTCGDRNAAPRHKTLRNAIEWSFDLCSDIERTLWARASVFAGGFDLEAAEEVCAGADLPADEVLTAVTGLIEKSILTRSESASPARYRMLETIRQYGCERLGKRGEQAETRRRHRNYYLRLAERAEADSFGPRQRDWFARLRMERPNLWVALDYCLTEPGEARTGLRMAGALWVYWVACGLVRDGRHWLGRALAADDGPSGERATALWVNGWIACLQGDTVAALACLDEGRDLAARLSDEHALTRNIQFSGTAHLFRNDLLGAVPFLDEALARDHAQGTVSAPAIIAFVERADAACMLGDLSLAESLCRDCMALCERHGELWTLSWVTWLVGVISWMRGDLRSAAARLRESLRDKASLNDQLGVPFCLDLLAWIASSAADYERAAVLFGAAETMWQTIGTPLFGFTILLDWRAQRTKAARHGIGEQAFEAAHERGMRLSSEAAVTLALGGKPVPATGVDVELSEPEITRREREVAALVARGMSNREIADRLVISRRTAECHIAHVLTKLGFTSRTQIAAWVAAHPTQPSP